jgi:hypothetical protein
MTAAGTSGGTLNVSLPSAPASYCATVPLPELAAYTLLPSGLTAMPYVGPATRGPTDVGTTAGLFGVRAPSAPTSYCDTVEGMLAT